MADEVAGRVKMVWRGGMTIKAARRNSRAGIEKAEYSSCSSLTEIWVSAVFLKDSRTAREISCTSFAGKELGSVLETKAPPRWTTKQPRGRRSGAYDCSTRENGF